MADAMTLEKLKELRDEWQRRAESFANLPKCGVPAAASIRIHNDAAAAKPIAVALAYAVEQIERLSSTENGSIESARAYLRNAGLEYDYDQWRTSKIMGDSSYG